MFILFNARKFFTYRASTVFMDFWKEEIKLCHKNEKGKWQDHTSSIKMFQQGSIEVTGFCISSWWWNFSFFISLYCNMELRLHTRLYSYEIASFPSSPRQWIWKGHRKVLVTAETSRYWNLTLFPQGVLRRNRIAYVAMAHMEITLLAFACGN